VNGGAQSDTEAKAVSIPVSPGLPSLPALPDEATLVRQLKAQLGQAKQVIASRDAELRAGVAQRSMLHSQVVELQARLRQFEPHAAREAELRGKLAELEAENANLQTAETARQTEEIADKNARIRELESALAARDDKIRQLERDLADGLAWGESPVPDDLKRIRGIGAGFERALIEIGVTKLSQIASWTPEDVARIAARLKVRPERILRDGWVESARRLTGLANG
jgi:predicted flap endonuclease-1-like 5' DNA nuclease